MKINYWTVGTPAVIAAAVVLGLLGHGFILSPFLIGMVFALLFIIGWEVGNYEAKGPRSLHRLYKSVASTLVLAWPKSADGVAIQPGMKLWDANGTESVVQFIAFECGDHEPSWPEFKAKNGLIAYAHNQHGRFRWWMCYSTEQAARNSKENASGQ